MTMDTAEPIRMSSLIRQVMTSADKTVDGWGIGFAKEALYGEFLRSLDNIHLGKSVLAYFEW